MIWAREESGRSVALRLDAGRPAQRGIVGSRVTPRHCPSHWCRSGSAYCRSRPPRWYRNH